MILSYLYGILKLLAEVNYRALYPYFYTFRGEIWTPTLSPYLLVSQRQMSDCMSKYQEYIKLANSNRHLQ